MMLSLLLACAAPEPPVPAPAEAPVEPPPQPEPPPPPPRATDTIEVLPRSSWGAKPPEPEGLLPHTITHLTVHHSATRAPDAVSAPKRILGYQRYHQSKGFPDIAYHFVVDRAGTVYEGRSVDYAGSTFTDYDPSGHFLPLLDGNFEEQEPTDEQLVSLVRLLAWASERWHVPPDTIGAHKDFAHTLCPGKNVDARVKSGEIARRVSEIVDSTDVSLVVLGDEEGRKRLPK